MSSEVNERRGDGKGPRRLDGVQAPIADASAPPGAAQLAADAQSAAAAPGRLASRGLAWPWILLICGLPLLLRWHLLSVPFAFNVDEAQWTVVARRAFDDPVLFRSLDLRTSGPLNALPIAWPILFGLTPTVLTSRLTAFVIQSLTLLGMTTFLRRGEAASPGTAALVAAAAWVALETHAMVLGYESETLPVALMVIFCAVYAGLRADAPPGPRLAVCGLIAVALPFAKMQAAPFALVFQAVCLFRLATDWRAGRAGAADVALWLAGGGAPLVLLVAPLFLVGEQDAFLKGYLGLTASYRGVEPLNLFRNASGTIAVMAVLWAAVVIRRRAPSIRRQARLDLLLLSAGLWPAALFAVWKPGHNFYHYLLFAVFGLSLSVLLAQYAFPVARPRLSIGLRIASGVVLVGLSSAGFLRAEFVRHASPLDLYRKGALDRAFPAPGRNARPLFAWTGAEAPETMLSWGYEPEYTAFSGMKSAERAAEGEYEIRPNAGRDYFRARLLRDLARSNPALVLDAGRRDYSFTDLYPDFDPRTERWDIASFPALEQFVAANYDLVAGGGRCAGLYLRKDKAAALRAAEVPLRSAVPALTDGPATERCDDWWAPDRSDATAVLEPTTPAPVKEVWVLSSRGGKARRRGTTRAALAFVGASGIRAERAAPLYEYPNWTVIEAPDVGPLARIEVRSLAAVGEGPALAGVRAFDRPWSNASPPAW